MTRERLKQLLPAMEHWHKGGNLWFYSTFLKEWLKYEVKDIRFEDKDPTSYIIEDKFFEARKAHALGKPIEYKQGIYDYWKPVTKNTTLWYKGCMYRTVRKRYTFDEKEECYS